MPGAADVLRAAGVARAFLRLVGRNRAAIAVAFIISVGWFVYGLTGSGAHAHAGAEPVGAFAGALGLIVTGPYPDRDRDGDRDAGARSGGALGAAVHVGVSVLGRTVGALHDVAAAGRWALDVLPAGALRPVLRPVIA